MNYETKAAKSVESVDAKASNITTVLNTIDSNKAMIVSLQKDNKLLVADAIKEVLGYVTALKSESPLYEGMTKVSLLRIVKTRLDSKNTLLLLVVNYLSENITINYELSQAQLAYMFKLLKADRISKQAFKGDIESLKLIIADNRKTDALAKAKALLK